MKPSPADTAQPRALLQADAQPYAPDARRPLRVRARRLLAETQIAPHSHAWAQVAYSLTGVMRVTAASQTYLVPPSRAVWIPPEVEHVVTVVEDAELRTLYLHQAPGASGPCALTAAVSPRAPGAAGACEPARPADWRRCRVLEVSPLLREAVAQLHGEASPSLPSAEDSATSSPRELVLGAIIQDELVRARALPLGVSLPDDKRLRSLCEAVLEDPARHATLEGWSRAAGASPRTVARLFRKELGTTFAEWRLQVMLAKALLMAARKRPMSHIAAELGYASPSAFTAMVRRSVGEPPSRFFASVP